MAVKRKPTSKSDEARRSFVQQLAAQIPWFHNCVLLDRVTHPSQHEWGISTALSSKGGGYRRALKYMRAFAAAWTDRSIVQEGLAQILWFHNIALLEKLSRA